MFFNKRIYADTASSTPTDFRVSLAMKKVQKKYGNPSSIHKEGQEAEKVLNEARKNIAKHLGCNSEEIIFTGSGSEANNLAILGTAHFWQDEKKDVGHIISSAIEHHSVLSPMKHLSKKGWGNILLSVDENGQIDLKELDSLISHKTALVSLAIVNNEIGSIQPIKEVIKRIRKQRAETHSNFPYFHIDACQAGRFFDLNVLKLGVDLLTINGSKIYGPKGIGLLYKRRDVKINPVIFGGGQEFGLRSGTQNIVGATGLSRAFDICQKRKEKESKKITGIKNYFVKKVKKEIPDIVFNGNPELSAPHIVNFSVKDVSAELLVIELDAKGVAVSTGSACSSMSENDSHVVLALSKDKKRAESAIRFSFDRKTSKRDIDKIIKIIIPIIKKIRGLNLKNAN